MANKKRKAAGSGDPRATELVREKLEGSGLDMEDAELLGMVAIDGNETARLHPAFKPVCSLLINYYGPDGKPVSDVAGGEPFQRVRYLEATADFAALADKKPVRYVQRPNTLPCAYFPRSQPDWPAILADADRPLVVTEGELKAAKACKEGFPTVGLGGVYNWRALKMGVELLPELQAVEWQRRNVYVCYDSDYRTNPMVCAALRQLAEELARRGAFVHVVSLPNVEDLEKVGLDDFLVHAGANANAAFAALLSEAEPLGLTRPLFVLNDRYAYVRNPGLVADLSTMFKAAPGAFKEHLEAALSYQERELRADGSVSYKRVSAASAWLRWPLRHEVEALTYRPGEEREPLGCSGPLLNIWPGWGAEPAERATKKDVAPFLELVDHLFAGAEPEAKEWFLRWCAFPLKNPGAKMFSSAVVHGIRHGTGKSLVGYTLARIYGKNFTEVSQMDLHNGFNEWAEAKQFVMGDDVTGSNKRADADYLKKLITQKELRINAKYMPSYVVPDCINYFFTANQPDAFFLEDDDRRFFIHEVTVGPLPEAFYAGYEAWLAGDGASKVFRWLLDLDMGTFNPAAPAFKTQAKERMTVNVQSDLAGWVRNLLATPDAVLRVGKVKVEKDLFTSKELLLFYDPEGRTGTTANGLGRELARAGVRQVCGGRPVRLLDGTQGRYYAVREVAKWADAQPAAVGKHLEAWAKRAGTALAGRR